MPDFKPERRLFLSRILHFFFLSAIFRLSIHTLTLSQKGPPLSSQIPALFLLSLAFYLSRPTKFAPMGASPQKGRLWTGIAATSMVVASGGNEEECFLIFAYLAGNVCVVVCSAA
jgi:hypothetical protein